MFDKFKSALAVFYERYLASKPTETVDWNCQAARTLRYEILWAMYQDQSYRNIHSWAQRYRHDYGLYKYIRPIYNPTYRLGQFWQAHIFGGLLDSQAGNAGCIPIVTDNPALSQAIARLWQASRWQVNKDVLVARTSVLGDGAVRVIDDVERGAVYLDIVHPGSFESVDLDPFGNVKGYVIREKRPDPERGYTSNAEYVEEVTRDGESVAYRTYRNGDLYAWDNGAAEWAEPYGFVPLVVLQHEDVGLQWGWSCVHAVSEKIREVDGLASQLSDSVRKTIDPVWLMQGIKRTDLTIRGNSPTDAAPEPGREELRALWGVPANGNAKALIPDVDFAGVLAHIAELLKEIERDLPELGQDTKTASGDASGRALRVARQPIVSKVLARRAGYDDAIKRAMQMAIAIGGLRKYKGYNGFNLQSYASGALDFDIGGRPVYEEDPLDKEDVQAAIWTSVQAAVNAGASLAGVLRDRGFSEERIKLLTTSDAAVNNTEE